MDLLIKVIGIKINHMETEFIKCKMEPYTVDNSCMGQSLEKEDMNLLMAQYIKVNFLMGNFTGEEF